MERAAQVSAPAAVVRALCLECGLCCNGAIFRDVELQPSDDAGRLAELGMPLEQGKPGLRFPQPCGALQGCRCSIYRERPARCREFECGLLRAVAAGKVTREAAWRHIRKARRLMARVDKLLRLHGDRTEARSLEQRFQRTRRRMEREADAASAASFGELALAMHTLNCHLQGVFHPGDALPGSRR